MHVAYLLTMMWKLNVGDAAGRSNTMVEDADVLKINTMWRIDLNFPLVMPPATRQSMSSIGRWNMASRFTFCCCYDIFSLATWLPTRLCVSLFRLLLWSLVCLLSFVYRKKMFPIMFSDTIARNSNQDVSADRNCH